MTTKFSTLEDIVCRHSKEAPTMTGLGFADP
jgi:hypothetical protein